MNVIFSLFFFFFHIYHVPSFFHIFKITIIPFLLQVLKLLIVNPNVLCYLSVVYCFWSYSSICFYLSIKKKMCYLCSGYDPATYLMLFELGSFSILYVNAQTEVIFLLVKCCCAACFILMSFKMQIHSE